MKTMFTIVIVFFAYLVNAQQANFPISNAGINTPKHFMGNAGVNKNTGMGSRLIAVSNSTDSTHYIFSNGRGGDENTGVKYDTANSYTYDTTAHVFKISTRHYATYDANNGLLSDVSQTFMNSVWTNTTRLVYQKNGMELDTTIENDTWIAATHIWRPVSVSYYTYTSAGNVKVFVGKTYDTVAMVLKNYNKDVYVYDATNKLTSDTSLNWDSASNMWVTHIAETLFYNGNLLKYKSDSLNPVQNGFYKSIYNYYYNSSNFLIATSDIALYNNLTFPARDSQAFTVNSVGAILTEEDLIDGMLVNGYSFTYNTYGQQTTYQFYIYNNNVPTIVAYINYFYETYTTGISAVSLKQGIITLMPNPANDKIRVLFNFSSLQSARGSIIDITGKEYYYWDENSVSIIDKIVPIAVLPAGIYLLRIDNAEGVITQRFEVIH